MICKSSRPKIIKAYPWPELATRRAGGAMHRAFRPDGKTRERTNRTRPTAIPGIRCGSLAGQAASLVVGRRAGRPDRRRTPRGTDRERLPVGAGPRGLHRTRTPPRLGPDHPQALVVPARLRPGLPSPSSQRVPVNPRRNRSYSPMGTHLHTNVDPSCLKACQTVVLSPVVPGVDRAC